MPEVLKERLDCLAEEIQKDKFNETSLVIVSGRGKVDIEANFMAEYLSQKHSEVMKDKILIIEAYSMNSVENFLMSFFQLWQKYREEEHKFFKMKVVTSSFHADRVKYIGEQCIPKLRKSL